MSEDAFEPYRDWTPDDDMDGEPMRRQFSFEDIVRWFRLSNEAIMTANEWRRRMESEG